MTNQLLAELEMVNCKLENINDYVTNELSHLLANDEETWNEEFYTNGKLDYRKLCIQFLKDIKEMSK